MSSAGRLAGKVVLLTGAAGGQGLVAAEALAGHGATVFATDRESKPSEQLRALCEELAIGYRGCDLVDEAGVGALVDAVLAEHGRIDGLYCNHGAVRPEPIVGERSEVLDLLLDVNVRSVYFLNRAVAKPMVEAGSGSIVNVASSIAFRAAPGLAAYSMTKAAVIQLTRVVACELASSGVRANALCPGVIETPMTLAPLAGLPTEAREQALDAMGAMAPLGRMGQPGEVVPLAVHLLSDEASYTTGAVFAVDGGVSAAPQELV